MAYNNCFKCGKDVHPMDNDCGCSETPKKESLPRQPNALYIPDRNHKVSMVALHPHHISIARAEKMIDWLQRLIDWKEARGFK